MLSGYSDARAHVCVCGGGGTVPRTAAPKKPFTGALDSSGSVEGR